MADAQVLRELADEVESLSKEGSFDVECRILTALYPQVHVAGGVALWIDEDRPAVRVRIRSCTRSIDDAADLMPEGWFASVRQTLDGVWSTWARRAVPLGMQPEPPRGCARTEALARTACALRALAADLEGKTTNA